MEDQIKRLAKDRSSDPVAYPLQEEQEHVKARRLTSACPAAPAPTHLLPLASIRADEDVSRTLESAREAEHVPLSDWHICGEAVIGLAHRRKRIPCQDAIAYRSTPRPILALSDGASSAAVSEIGARAMVAGISRFLMSLEDDLAQWLDDTEATPSDQTVRWAGRLLRHAQGVLEDLARSERRNVRDLRGTLLLAVIGMRQAFWWQVGDGAIVVRHADSLRVLGNPASSKGEFANQTCFVDIADIGMVQYGVLPTPEIVGLALMSDGGAEKMVAHDGSQVATRLGEWFDAVADDRFSPDKIALAFHEPAMWERTNLDDRSVVFAARRVSLMKHYVAAPSTAACISTKPK